MGLVLLILVILLICGGIPLYRSENYGPRYGYGVGGLGFVLLIVLIIMLLSHSVVIW